MQCTIISILEPNQTSSTLLAQPTELIDDTETDNETGESSGKDGIDMRLILAVLVGDSLCNFADGVFIGIAIFRCNASIAWAVIGVSLYHEIAQELADYFLLTNVAGLVPWKALLVNFTTGLSVVFGGFLVLLVNLSNMSMGVLLALGSGVYIYISCCECIPRVNSVAQGPAHIRISCALFAVGAIPIGLTLLGHVHCDAH